MPEIKAWFFDLYENAAGGITLWFITEKNERLKVSQSFLVSFCVHGSVDDLSHLEAFLNAQSILCQCKYEQHRDLYTQKMLRVLSIQTQPQVSKKLFKLVNMEFPYLEYFDVDISTQLRHAALYGTFPLALCQVTYSHDKLIELKILEDAWALDPTHPPFRFMRIRPDCNPRFSKPGFIEVQFDSNYYRYDIGYTQSTLLRISALLESYDPDFLITEFGDTWLLPFLISAAQQEKIPLKLNRDTAKEPLIKKEGSYMSYGRYIYRGQQVYLFGRCHIDSHNAMLWQEYELESALEMARVTSLPIQTASRASPGTGINSIEIRTALRQNVLVPWHKTHGEETKTAANLLRADQGGLVYQPIAGLHEDVGMIDFISLYPSIMTYCNISPEKPIPRHLASSAEEPGLIPQTLRPLLEKRIALKKRAALLPPDDLRLEFDKTRSAALKMLLVCCFGYLGYKAAKFGRIESHEAISALGREALLTAKEAAEDFGFSVLHLYVDGIWVRKAGIKTKADFVPLLDEISRRTCLPIALDAIYKWVAFLPSRADNRMSVPNRYFGLKQDGTITVRGVDIRKHDTPAFIARFQQDLIHLLSQMECAVEIRKQKHRLLDLYQRRYHMLQKGLIHPQDLVVHKRVTRDIDSYRVASGTALASMQLSALGQAPRLGQRVAFLYTRGSSKVTAWHTDLMPNAKLINFPYYCILLTRAANTILQPLGITQQDLDEYVQRKIIPKPLFQVS